MKMRAMVSLVAAAAVLAACSSSDDDPVREPDTKDGSQLVQISPLTGERLENGLPDHAPFVVKIDNTRAATPQTGLDQADLVVEETVEGGATRLAAIFYSQMPESVGHVRSVRATDIGIAKPASAHIVASGGAPQTFDRLREAQVPIVSEDGGAEGFSRKTGKAAPYNVLVNLRHLTEQIGPVRPSVPYLPWAAADDEATPAPTAVTAASVRFSNFHTTEWTHGEGGWTRANGIAQPEFMARNLLVLFADEVDAGYRDPAGNPVPETNFVGSGRAVVFAGGGVIEGTWSKRDHASQIQLVDGSGTPIELAPGKTWIELVNNSTADVNWR
ncbi:DUF3048 domain-containing protein [uncultured Aeromicrobium sp.]|uniref:DUF3048 domain-containing protein n=1 Tax=uncultured Aeromicrobium sp. TaxID=337820 RepID=UPI0025E0D503|nr:DUF3048 domain-containing protein [uncultured Aeromicrobium sp.]